MPKASANNITMNYDQQEPESHSLSRRVARRDRPRLFTSHSGGSAVPHWEARRGCQPAALVAVRETGLMWANMLRAFHVGKALTSDGEPSSWMRPSRVAWAQVSWPACHLTKASASAVMYRVLVLARARLADLGVSELMSSRKRSPARPAGEVEADDDASMREPVSAERVAHRPQGHKGVEVRPFDRQTS